MTDTAKQKGNSLAIEASGHPLDLLIQSVQSELEWQKVNEPELFEQGLKFLELLFDSGDFLFKLTGVQLDAGSAPAGKLFVLLYPSERFLVLARAIFARDLNGFGVE